MSARDREARWAFAAVNALVVAGCVHAAPALPSPPIDISLEQTPDGQLVVPVVIDGKPPAPFILDTGASATVISPELVSMLSLQPSVLVREEVVTAAGTRPGGPVYILQNVTVGGRDFGELNATSTSMEDLSTRTFPIAGILGQDFLAGELVDFDFPAHRLRIKVASDSARPSDMVAIPFRKLDAGLLVVDAKLNGGPAFPAVIDLGAQASILNPAGAKGGGTPAGKAAAAMGADGAAAAVIPQTFARLEIGAVAFENLPLYVGDLPVFTQLGLASGPALILGLDLLAKREVVLDYGRGLLFIGPLK